MSETSDEFGDWWNGDYDGSKNPYREGSPAYWAWAGWEAAVRVNAIKEVQRLGQDIQLEWVGLTEREQGAIMEDLNAYGTNLYQFAQAIEAKLKEKNQ